MRIACLLCFLLLFQSLAAASGSVIVLCYHSFKGNGMDTDIAPDDFSEQIRSIRKLGYRFVSFQEIENNQVTGNRNVLITIDDGHKSLQNVYDGVLRKNGIKPVLFIYPNLIGKVPYALTFDELRAYQKDGATIGAHGYYHLFVTRKLYKKNKKAFMKEIYKAKEVLESRMKREVTIFSYPFGSYSDITEEHLANAGMKYAFTLKWSSLRVPLSGNGDLFQLPRHMVTNRSWKGIYSLMKRHAGKISPGKKAVRIQV